MKIALCDDHKETLEELRFFLSEITITADAEIHTFDKSVDLINRIKQGDSFDLYILDIYIDNNLGTDVAQLIRQRDGKANIIFVTSSPDFALESYEYQALHYLLKPIDYKDLQNALTRMQYVEEPSLLCMAADKGQVRIKLSDIICIINNKNRQMIISTHTTAHLNSTIKEIAASLADNKDFHRLSSGCILNLKRVVSLNSKEATLEGGNVVTIPRGRYRILKGLCEEAQNRKI